MRRRPICIANFSGYLGDRYTALDEVMAGDPVDILVGDYLAEITLAMLSTRYLKDQSKGYVDYFLRQIRPHLAAIARRGCKVVTNAGGFNPAGLADALRHMIAEAGLSLRVAHIEGDNVLPQLGTLQAAGHRFENLDTGAPLSSWGVQPITANAYLGGWGIAAALEEGVDIVVCGGVTDASLVLGPAAWWHGWSSTDWNALAGAVIAGHIIECGPQAVGGNFTGFARIPGMVKPGFPIAEVASDGSSVITKHRGAGGAVTADTVIAQLMYEIQGPRYLNPDVTAHIDSVKVRQAGPDRVELSGITGSPPPPTTKVAIFAPIGYHIVNTVYATGLDSARKIDLIRTQIHELISSPGIDEIEITAFGAAAVDPVSQWAATVPVRIMATSREREPLLDHNFSARIASLYLSSIPGLYTDTGAARETEPRARIEYWPALLPMAAVEHRVVSGNGRCRIIAPSAVTALPEQPAHPEPEPLAATRTRRLPLGTLAYARSGDKGGNSNIGIWVRDERAWPWLRQTLSTKTLRHLMPEAAELDVVRHEFPRLRAVHFVVRGLLGNGGSSNLRADQVGKAIGDYLLARHVDIPETLLAALGDNDAH